MDKLFLNKGLVTETALTQDGVLAYITLRIIIDESIPLYNKTSSVDCVSLNRMAFALVGFQEKYEKVLIDSLYRGIFELVNKDVLAIIKDLSSNNYSEYLLDITNLYFDVEKDNFIMVSPDEVHKILDCNEIMKKKISMLRYFVALVGTFNWSKSMQKLQGKIGTMSMEYIAMQADISSRTCIRYNKILSKMKMIYVYKSNDKERVGDKLKQIKNCYSRYADKDACEEYASNYENWYGSQHIIVRTQKNKEQADNNRRLAAIYNRICDGYGDTYDEATIKEVYRYILNKNRAIQKEIDAKYNQKYLTDSDKRWITELKSQLRDESVFEQFDFLKDDNWGEPNSIDTDDNDFSIEEILDMPIESDLTQEPEKSTLSEDKSVDVDTFPMNPVKTITIKKKVQNREKPKDIEIQEYAETLYEQYGYGTEYKKSLFIVELAEKYPGLDNYEKYYDRIKLLREMGL